MSEANRRPPVPPFTEATATQKVQAAEDAWNSCDPDRVALAYTEDSQWRNRDEFFQGRDAIRAFLTRNGLASSTTRYTRSCGALPRTASRSGANTNLGMPPDNGGEATATNTGSSTNTG
jgi:nuclear transport factor 2 (NTF2) superfamily protein